MARLNRDIWYSEKIDERTTRHMPSTQYDSVWEFISHMLGLLVGLPIAGLLACSAVYLGLKFIGWIANL